MKSLRAQSGIFVCGAGLACVQHRSNYQLADVNHPVSPGETIIIYAIGLGALATSQTDGEPATGPDSTVVTPTVTIAGMLAKVLYSGLTPGDIGLYQLDVVVPANAPIGAQLVTVTMQDVVSGTKEFTVAPGTLVSRAPAFSRRWAVADGIDPGRRQGGKGCYSNGAL
ncbi:MAG: hypothetical protein ACLP59_33180 [Bryobacteraceae bacterium]